MLLNFDLILQKSLLVKNSNFKPLYINWDLNYENLNSQTLDKLFKSPKVLPAQWEFYLFQVSHKT